MTDNISLVGVVATPPKSMQTNSGLSIVSFRLASSQRRYDRTRNLWVDADTNWYTVTAFRQLADNAIASLSKGDRVVVSGRLRVRSWENGERSGTAVEVDADALGPDLLFGTTTFTRVVRASEQGAHDSGVVAESGGSASLGGPESNHGDDPHEQLAPGGFAPGGFGGGDLAGGGESGVTPAAGAVGETAVGGTAAGGTAVGGTTAGGGELVGAAVGAGQWHPATDETPF